MIEFSKCMICARIIVSGSFYKNQRTGCTCGIKRVLMAVRPGWDGRKLHEFRN